MFPQAQPQTPGPSLDCTPFPQPIKAMDYYADLLLNKWRYPTQEQATAAAKTANWLLWLGANGVDFAHTDPVMLVAVARMAIDAQFRADVMGAGQKIDTAVALFMQQSAPAPAAAPTGGFKAGG